MAYVIVNGTNANNATINFIGILNTSFSQVFVNPYSGFTITITGVKNVNNGIYDGLGGYDNISMTSEGDVLTLVDSAGTIMIKNIEQITGAAGGDIIIMAHETATYGNINLRGTFGDDILWGNIGDDLIFGQDDNDILDGGPGNDQLYGGNGNDYLSGWTGSDSLLGGAGDDTLVYNADAVWTGGILLSNLTTYIPFAGSINLDGYNRSHDLFHGDGTESYLSGVPAGGIGVDTLLMTSGNDALIIGDTLSPGGVIAPRVQYMDIIDAGAGDDIVDMTGADHYSGVTVYGRDGDDILGGTAHADTIDGGDGNDRIYGSGGADTLRGGVGDDAYYYNPGDGDDTIIETSGTDSIVFGAGIALGDITFTVSGEDLILGVPGGNLKITGHFADDLSGRVESLHFADNSTYDLASYSPPAPPVATDDAYTGDEDTLITGNVLDNDTDANGDTLSVEAQTLTTANGGAVTIHADGTFSYLGAANFNGSDSFDYKVLDGNGGFDTGTVSLTVHAVNDAPVAVDDAFSGDEDALITGSVLDNDSDIDGDTLSVEAQTLTTANGGAVTIHADGTFSYLGAANFNGTDSFTYTMRDPGGLSSIGNVLLSIAAVNDAPAAAADAFTGLRGNAITGDLLADNGAGADGDIDGDALSVQAASFATAGGGIVTLSSDGTFTYAPADHFHGQDFFDYTVLDGNGGTDTATVTLTVALDPSAIVGDDTGGDTLNGTIGADQIFGLGGDDILRGDGGAATVLTVDKAFSDPIVFPNLKGGVNIANLVPPGTPALGVVEGNLNVSYDATATLTFRKGFASYNNSLGAFAITEDGKLVDAKMYWTNVKTAGTDVAHQIDLPTGEDGGNFGFFIVANGDTANGDTANGGYTGLDMGGDGTLKFIYNYGKAGQRTAKITDPGSKISLVYDDGVTVKVLKGNVYFTTERGESTAVNKDGKVHSMSGLLDTNNLSLDIKKADLSGKPKIFTKNGITLEAIGGCLAAGGDRVGVVSTGGPSDVIAGKEGVRASFEGSESVVLSLGNLKGEGRAVDFKIYLDGSSTAINYEYVISDKPKGGKIDILLDADAFGGGLITSIVVQSLANSSHGTENFWINNIRANVPGGVEQDTLRIGFEDLYNTGDADYEDVLFDLNINPHTTVIEEGGDDYLDGGAGNDTLYGEGGNDILVIGLGADTATGGTGADVFKVTAIDTLRDTIMDFKASEGDKIDLSAILEGFDPLTSDIANFVRLVQTGGDVELQVNADGAGTDFAAAVLIAGGVSGASVESLLTSGALVAA